MDSTSPVQAVAPGYVVSAKNCHPGYSGGWIKRDGYTAQLNTAWGTHQITGGIEYRAGAGSRITIVFGTDGTGGTGRIGFVTAGAVTDISTGLDGSVRPSFIQAGDLLFFYNGSDAPVLYDGSTTRQVGITAPAAAPTVALGVGGSLNTNASYIWAYTYYNSVTGAESSPSALSLTTATGANTKGTLTILAGTSTTADTIRVWRTVANGNTLYLDGTAAISATSYVSSVADAALTTQMELDNSRITAFTSTAKFPVVAQQRVFVKIGRNQIRYSKWGQSGPMYESFEARALVNTTGTFGSNDDIVGHATAGDTPIVLKERSFGRLDAIGVATNLLATDQVFYVYTELSRNVQPVGHGATTQVFGECIFLAKDNIYGTRGQDGDLRPLANSMQATIRALGNSSTQVTRVSAANDVRYRRVYFAVFSSSSASTPDYILVGDYQTYPEFRWSLYTPGSSSVTWPGIKAGCFIQVTNSTDGNQDILFGNAAGNGQLYRMNDGTTDAGSGIYFEIVSRPYTMGSLASIKLYTDALVYALGSGNAYNLTVSAIYDLSGEEESSYDISLSSGGALWDNVNWDAFVWSSNASPPRKYFAHRKARHQQLVFRQTSATAPLTLFSWVPTASIFKPF